MIHTVKVGVVGPDPGSCHRDIVALVALLDACVVASADGGDYAGAGFVSSEVIEQAHGDGVEAGDAWNGRATIGYAWTRSGSGLAAERVESVAAEAVELARQRSARIG